MVWYRVFISLSLGALLLAECGTTSEEQIQTAIALTEQAQPTNTLEPTSTIPPAPTDTPNPSPTVDFCVGATLSNYLEQIKEDVSGALELNLEYNKLLSNLLDEGSADFVDLINLTRMRTNTRVIKVSVTALSGDRHCGGRELDQTLIEGLDFLIQSMTTLDNILSNSEGNLDNVMDDYIEASTLITKAGDIFIDLYE